METVEGNKLIAEFMGCYGATHYIGGEAGFYWGFKDTHITERWDERDFERMTPYHSSWDWQVPVWSKIGKSVKQLACDGSDEQYKKYVSFIDRYENAVFDNTPEIGQQIIVEAIQFYNTTKNQTNDR